MSVQATGRPVVWRTPTGGETYQYASLGDFIDTLERAPRLESNFQSRERFKERGIGRALTGEVRGWEAIKTLWREGWPEGVRRMREALEALEPPRVKDRRRKARWSDEGEEFSRERLMGGYYDSPWRQMHREARQAPVPVRITVDVEAHVFVSHGDMFWRGAGAVLLAESLAVCGYPVQIVATSGASGMGMQGGNYEQYITVTVKDWPEPTYLPTLIATAGHGAFLRVGVFAHNVSYMPRQHTGGMGYSIETHSTNALAHLGFNESNIRTMSMPLTVVTQEAAQAWVRDTVAALEGAEQGAEL